MISRVSPQIRRRLVAARIAAMTRGSAEGLRELAEARSATNGALDQTAVGLLESEIYALDIQPQKALAAFVQHVDPLLSVLDPRIAAVVADNKAQLSMDSFEGVGEFYHLVDVRRILGVEIRDHAAILEAGSQAAAGKHFDALPAYWQQLRSAYELQNWRARRMAERDFTSECIQLDLLDEAAYHAMLAENKEAVEWVSKVVMAVRSPDQVRRVVNKILGAAGLRRHAIQAARIFATLADAIPDELISSVAMFLSKHATGQVTGWHDSALLESVWESLKGIAHRLDGDAVRLLTEIGVKQVLGTAGPVRSNVINGLNALTARQNPKELEALADAAISLVTTGRHDSDYAEALNWTCHIADRGGDVLKSKIRSFLFPVGSEVKDALLVQVGPVLGWVPQRPESFVDATMKTIEAVRKQVQRLTPGEEPAKIGGYATFNSSGPGGQIVVHVHGAVHLIEALAAYPKLINAQALTRLLEAMLDMIAERENLIANRVSLTSLLRKFADQFPPELIQRTADVLQPLALGDITEPSRGQTHAEAKNLLNPFKIGGGNPVDLRGAALLFLAVLDREHENVLPAFHDQILLSAITSANAEVRRYGLFAARESGKLNPAEKAAVALASLDPDPKVALWAFRALGESSGGINFETWSWQIIVRAIEIATFSSDGGLRATAAKMLKKLIDVPVEVGARLETSREALKQDVLYSVRNAITLGG